MQVAYSNSSLFNITRLIGPDFINFSLSLASVNTLLSDFIYALEWLKFINILNFDFKMYFVLGA